MAKISLLIRKKFHGWNFSYESFYIYILFLQGNSFNPENPDLNKNLLLFMREINPQNFHHFSHRL